MVQAVLFHDAVALAGGFPLLSGIDLEVAEGEVVHLRGPNGAGKTSLLRAAAGLVPIVRGTAVVLGHDLRRDRRSVRRHVGLLGHSGFLYEEMTVEENLRFAARAARVGTGAVGPALERVQLAGRLATVPLVKLSAGQRRRASLAALIARAPRLWLLDEPHAGLDEDGRELVDSVVTEASAGGSTVLLASHEHDRAASIADRVVTIAGGQVVSPAPAPVPAPAPARVPVVGGGGAALQRVAHAV
jgi:heme ABC exporter ATP-binding subunit CcmA